MCVQKCQSIVILKVILLSLPSLPNPLFRGGCIFSARAPGPILSVTALHTWGGKVKTL